MLGVKSVVFPACAALCALALLYKLRDVRHHRRDPALIALIIAFSCKGISFTLSTPTVSATVDSALGVPNLGALGIHLLGGVCSSAAFLIAIVYWVYPREEAGRRALVRLVIAALCAAAMLTLWSVAGSQSQGRSAHYLLQNAHRPLVAGYLLLYVSAFGSGMVEIMRLCLRYGRVAGRQWLRRGLFSTGIGAGACLIYCLNRAASLVAVQSGLEPLDWELLTPVANGIGISFLVAGLTMPSWGPRLSDWRRLARNFWAYQRLHPLWRALYGALPHIALSPEPPTLLARLSRFAPRDINYRLYRKVIEIQDGLLVLRPYMEPAAMAAAGRDAQRAGLSGEELRATVYATAVRAALRAKRDNAPVGAHPVVPEPSSAKEGDYAGEVAWLLSVARAYKSLPPAAPSPSTDRTTEETPASPENRSTR